MRLTTSHERVAINRFGHDLLLAVAPHQNLGIGGHDHKRDVAALQLLLKRSARCLAQDEIDHGHIDLGVLELFSASLRALERDR